MTAPAACTVYFDGACPLCRREIAHYRRRAAGAEIRWVDASVCDEGALGHGLSRSEALSRLHVRAADGSLVSGAAAFAAIWARVPGYRWLAAVASRRPVLRLLEALYVGFLRLRPLWRRAEAAEATAVTGDEAGVPPLGRCVEVAEATAVTGTRADVRPRQRRLEAADSARVTHTHADHTHADVRSPAPQAESAGLSVAPPAQERSPSSPARAAPQTALRSATRPGGTHLVQAHSAAAAPSLALPGAGEVKPSVLQQSSMGLRPWHRRAYAGTVPDGVHEPESPAVVRRRAVVPPAGALLRAAASPALARPRIGAAPRLPAELIADLRTDHAIEVAAVQVYRGVLAVSSDGELRASAARHLASGLLRLQRLGRRLPARERSRLLPLWRAMGWLAGAVSALLGPKAVAATIAAAERAVGRHDERQSAPRAALPQNAAPRAAFDDCRGDGLGRRSDASPPRARPRPVAHLWTALLGKGSRLAVAASRRW